MIYLVRTARPVPGKMQEFMDWTTRVAAYRREHFPQARAVEACRPLSGERDLIRFVAKYDSLAAFEATEAASRDDTGWQKLIREHKGIMTPGIEDVFYEILE